MKYFIFLFCFYILIHSNGFAQVEAILSYDALTHKIDTIMPPIPSVVKSFDYTGSFYGNQPGFVYLDTTAPKNTYNTAGFTDFKPAERFFSLNCYPIRTAIKLLIKKNGIIKQRCSGIIVGKDLVLTANHCPCNMDSLGKSFFMDSLYVAPVFNDGKYNALYSRVDVVKTYSPLFNWSTGFYAARDASLLKLKEPIGLIAGWIGIGFSDSDDFYRNNVFHSLSYPGTRDDLDSTRVYNGDTLYYNYGKLDYIDQGQLGCFINGIPGQSGSSFFYTDNKIYFSVGTQTWSTYSWHYRIDKSIFYSFKSIIDAENEALSVNYDNIYNFDISNAFPNPFNPSTNIIYSLKKAGMVTIKIYDVLGTEVTTLLNNYKPSGKYMVSFNASKYPSGIYFYKIQMDGQQKTGKMVLVK